MMDEPLNHLPDDPALDRLLSEARWPATDARTLSRLRRAYLRDRWWMGFKPAAPLAAAALIVIAVGAWWAMHPPRQEPVAVIPPAPLPVHKRVADATIESRPATLLERAILYSAEARLSRPAVHPKTAVAAPEFDQRTVQRALTLYLSAVHQPTPADRAMAKLVDSPTAMVEEFFRKLNDPRVAARMAAARALGLIDGPIITQKLAEMVADDVNQREALAALISSRGREAEQVIAQARRHEPLAATIQSLEVELTYHAQGERL